MRRKRATRRETDGHQSDTAAWRGETGRTRHNASDMTHLALVERAGDGPAQPVELGLCHPSEEDGTSEGRDEGGGRAVRREHLVGMYACGCEKERVGSALAAMCAMWYCAGVG